MVQLTDDLLTALDREAQRSGQSRSALIRTAIASFLSQQGRDEQERRHVEGYRLHPPSVPDVWGDPEGQADTQGHDLALRLDAEERAAGLSW